MWIDLSFICGFVEHVFLFWKYTPDSLVSVFSVEYPRLKSHPIYLISVPSFLVYKMDFMNELRAVICAWYLAQSLVRLLALAMAGTSWRWGPDMSSWALMGFVMAFANRNDSLSSTGSFLQSLITLWLWTQSWHVNLLTTLESVMLERLSVIFMVHCLSWAWDSIHFHQDNLLASVLDLPDFPF